MSLKLLPSILNADFWNLGELIKATIEGGADGLHMDIMDGHFVPNLTFGPSVVGAVVKGVRKLCSGNEKLLIDSHLMIENPALYIPEFVRKGSRAISVHWETEKHLHRTVSLIRELGASPGVAINPATPVEFLEEILPFVDYVLIMSVNPGFGGQQFINTSLRKIEKLKNLIEKLELDVKIEVDGGIKLSNVEDIIKAGAEWIVVGSAIFASSNPREVYENTLKFKEKMEKFS